MAERKEALQKFSLDATIVINSKLSRTLIVVKKYRFESLIGTEIWNISD